MAPIRFEKDFYQKVKGMKQEMSKKWLRRSLSLLLVVLTFATSSLFVSSHELYYDSNGIDPIVPFRWNIKSSGKVYMTIGSDRTLGSSYTSSDDVAADAWDIACPEIVTTLVNVNPRVTFSQASISYWKNRYPDSFDTTLGVCDITTSDGVTVTNESSARRSNGKITSAYIRMTAYPEVFKGNTTYIRSVMVHELGHALGLGHPGVTSTVSVMQAAPPTTWYMPADHDKKDIAAWY